MLIHPWHEATKDEWQELLTHVDFGQVVAAGRGRDYPVVVPTHFHYDGADHVWLHLARPNPVWEAIEEHPHVLLRRRPAAAQLDQHEPDNSERVPPSSEIDSDSDRRLAPGIRGLRLTIESVQAKMKYGGNKTPEQRQAIAEHLAERDAPMDAAARARLLRRDGARH